MPKIATQDRALLSVIGFVGIAAVIGGTIIGVLWAMPDSSNPETILVIVLGFAATIVTALGNALLGGKANEKLDRVLNGEMDRKIEAAVHRVLDARELETLADRSGTKRQPRPQQKKGKL